MPWRRGQPNYAASTSRAAHFWNAPEQRGVARRTAQQAMRHSHIDLTMNAYTDPKLLDVHGAMDALPNLPLADDLADRETNQATGTD